MRSTVLCLTVCGLIMGCATWTGGARLQVAEHRRVDLPNGMHLFLLPDATLPRVGLIGLMRVGQRDENPELSGINSITANLLDQGTRDRDAVQLAEAFNSLGTEFGARPGADGTFIAVSSLSPDAEKAAELFADVLMNPTFSEKELLRLRSQDLAALRREQDNPSGYASKEFRLMVYDGHPYGRNSYGNVASLNRIQRSDVIRHYLSYYRPNNFSLAVTGRFDAALEKKIIDLFSAWPAKELKSNDVPKVMPGFSLKMKLVSKKGLEQTQIRIGQIGVSRADPDYLALTIAAEALGGSANSLLAQRLREEKGLTYSINAGLEGRRLTGLFDISTFTKNESVQKTLEETLKVFHEVTGKGLNEVQIAAAKAQLVGQYPRSVETRDDVATQILILELQNLPLTQVAEYPQLIQAVSSRQINDALRRHLSEDHLRILIYGDESVIGAQLQSWHPEVTKL